MENHKTKLFGQIQIFVMSENNIYLFHEQISKTWRNQFIENQSIKFLDLVDTHKVLNIKTINCILRAFCLLLSTLGILSNWTFSF